jgi:hypothetical protein
MPSATAICQWLENTSMATWVRESFWAFPTIETVHLFGIVILVGSTSVLDLRLLGRAFQDEPVSKLAGRMLPWAWTGLVMQVMTGFLLFSSEAMKCYQNIPFRIKMVLILLAGLNAFLFHAITYRRVTDWDRDSVAPIGARMAGIFSIVLWFGIVAAGRWISYL